jgi:excisionase family DNA binding protein
MEVLLTPTRAAELLGVSTNTLACWRSTKRYPLGFVRVGARVRYRVSDLERFINSRAEKPGAHSYART